MKRKTSATVIMYTVLVFFFVIWIFPIYTAITKSLQAGGWNSYLSVINNKDVHYFRVVFNSFFISVVTAVIVVVITSLAGLRLCQDEVHRFPGDLRAAARLHGRADCLRDHAAVLHHQDIRPDQHLPRHDHPVGGVQRPGRCCCSGATTSTACQTKSSKPPAWTAAVPCASGLVS